VGFGRVHRRQLRGRPSLLDVTAARNLIWLIVAAAVITAAAACVLEAARSATRQGAPQAGIVIRW